MVNQVTHGESKTPMYIDDLRGMAAQNRNWPMTSQLLERSVYSCWGTAQWQIISMKSSSYLTLK